MTLSLEWAQPMGLEDFTSNMNKKASKKISGVYLWGFKDNNFFIPYYLGKADNTYNRTYTHIGSLKGGLYNYYDVDYLKSGEYNFQKANKPEQHLYAPTSIFNYKSEFLDNENVQRTVEWMVKNFKLTNNNIGLEVF